MEQLHLIIKIEVKKEHQTSFEQLFDVLKEKKLSLGCDRIQLLRISNFEKIITYYVVEDWRGEGCFHRAKSGEYEMMMDEFYLTMVGPPQINYMDQVFDTAKNIT